VVTGVGIALGARGLDQCASLDRDRDQRVTVDELIAAVAGALTDCA
jgi:hypothetical protein